jgi:UDP-3-O-[3-hydroxymyristoyl] glucosamine N-acyltransferase
VSFTLAELAARVGGTVVGDGTRVVTAVRSLDDAGQGDLSFYHNRRYLHSALESRAGVLVVGEGESFPGRDLLVVADPYGALATILEALHPVARPSPGVHPTAVVAPGARLGSETHVGPHATVCEGAVVGDRAVISASSYVGEGAAVGADTLLHPHVVIEAGCAVGARCILHAGVVVGSDGFGFATVKGVHRKVPQVGTVVIEDDVELGANVCVDRATLGVTRVGRGTKVDNLVQIAHNVDVGEHSLLVSQVGISGSTRLGHHVVMGGQSGAVGHITLADGTRVTAKTGVTEDTRAGEMVSGFPSRPHREWLKAMANLFRLEELRHRIERLEQALTSSRSKE